MYINPTKVWKNSVKISKELNEISTEMTKIIIEGLKWLNELGGTNSDQQPLEQFENIDEYVYFLGYAKLMIINVLFTPLFVVRNI